MACQAKLLEEKYGGAMCMYSHTLDDPDVDGGQCFEEAADGSLSLSLSLSLARARARSLSLSLARSLARSLSRSL